MIQMGVKPFESRSWKMPNGITHLAIHAGQTMDWDAFEGPYRDIFLETFLLPPDASRADIERAMPKSAIVCVCRVKPSIRCGEGKVFFCKKTAHQNARIFGDFAPGRYAWPVEPVLQCQPPIRVKGAQGIWKLPEEIERVLLKELSAGNAGAE